MAHKIPPTNAEFLNGLERIKWKGGRRWKNEDGSRFFEWDELHGELEVYNSRGKHLGVVDPESGKFIKDALKGRSIDV